MSVCVCVTRDHTSCAVTASRLGVSLASGLRMQSTLILRIQRINIQGRVTKENTR